MDRHQLVEKYLGVKEELEQEKRILKERVEKLKSRTWEALEKKFKEEKVNNKIGVISGNSVITFNSGSLTEIKLVDKKNQVSDEDIKNLMGEVHVLQTDIENLKKEVVKLNKKDVVSYIKRLMEEELS